MKKYLELSLIATGIIAMNFLAQLAFMFIIEFMAVFTGPTYFFYELSYSISILLCTLVVLKYIKGKYGFDPASSFNNSNIKPSLMLNTALMAVSFSTILWFILDTIFYVLLDLRYVPQDFGISNYIIYLFEVIVIAPVCEELMFRAGILEVSKRRYGVLPALIVSSIAFGILHFTSVHVVVNAGIAGALYGYVYIRTGNICYPITMHLFDNMFSVGLDFLPENSFVARLLFYNVGETYMPSILFALIATALFICTAFYFKKHSSTDILI